MTPFYFVAPRTFRNRLAFPDADEWRFTAITVGSGTVCGYLGGLDRPVKLLGEQPVAGPLPPAWGVVTIGNIAGGIRPFKGWIGRFRIYGTALPAADIAAIHAGDIAAAAATVARLPPPRPEPARPLVLKRSAIPFSTRWERPDALPTMQSFHATDLLWVYGTKTEFVKTVQAAGLRYQGTLNGLQGSEKASPGSSIAGDTTPDIAETGTTVTTQTVTTETVLALYAQGLSQRAIAAQLGCSRATVRRRMASAA
jgi:hypothetical protein